AQVARKIPLLQVSARRPSGRARVGIGPWDGGGYGRTKRILRARRSFRLRTLEPGIWYDHTWPSARPARTCAPTRPFPARARRGACPARLSLGLTRVVPSLVVRHSR